MLDPNDNTNDLARIRIIDSICDRFENEWIAGQRPQIELYLNEVHGSNKQLLLMELVAIEVHYRRKKGESFEFVDYQTRFPGISVERLMLSVDKSMQGRKSISVIPPTEEQPTMDSGGKLPWESHKIFRNVQIGDYRIIEPIAQGGMGVVYKARQISLNRIVALKMILAGEFASKQEIDRFYLEARAAAMLDHPGIVPIIEVGEFDGRHFFSMAYVEGVSLSSRLNQGPMEPMEATTLVQSITEAIQYAHDHGVIHRDLKPSNILLDLQGNPRVTDFGLAKKVSENVGLTVSGQILGTPSFMPPEQAAGQIDSIGPASDVYSLGAVLYSLTTGRPPFQAASSIDTLRQVVEKEAVSPRQLNPSIPLDLETIILKCLEKSVPRRYPTAIALRDELQRFLQGIPIHARPISQIEKLWRWCKRQPAVASLSAVAVLLLLGLATGGFWAYFREVSFRNDLQVAFDNEKDAKNDAIEASHKALEASQAADSAAKLAEEARREKERQAEIAAQQRDNAKASEATMRRNLYISDVGRAHEAIQNSNYARASTLLERHRQRSSEQSDLRSLDWHLLQNQIVHPLFSWTFKNPVEVISISPDQSLVAVGCTGGRAYVVEIATGKVRENLPFFLEEEHWSTIGFTHGGLLVAHGRSGSMKFWDVAAGQTIAHKPRNLSPQFRDLRIPAAISSDGTRMLGADSGGWLALWDLEKLRPHAVRFANEGFHGHASNGSTFFALDISENLQASLIDHNIPIDAGNRDHREYILSKYLERHSGGYEPLGKPWYKAIDKLVENGHPVLSMVAKLGQVVLGKTTGEIEVVEQSDLENASRWIGAKSQLRKISGRPIVGVDYMNELDNVVATDSEQCFVLNAGTLEPIFSVPNSRAHFSKVSAVGQGCFAAGRVDGVVELWSAVDEDKVLEISTGTSRVTGIERIEDSLLVSNLDGKIGLYPMKFIKQDLVAGRGVVDESNPSPTTLFWLTSKKAFAIHYSLGSQLTSFRLANRNAPKRSIVAGAQLVSMDNLHPVIYHEQPNSKRLMGVFDKEIRLIDIHSLEVMKNIDASVGRNNTKDDHYAVSIFRRIENGFEGSTVDSSSVKTPFVSSQGRIIAADDFPDEKQVVTANTNYSLEKNGPYKTRLIIKDLDEDRIVSEVTIEGTQILPKTFQLTTLDQDRVLLDGVQFTDDSKHEHTLLYDRLASSVNLVASRDVDPSESTGHSRRQLFRFEGPPSRIAIMSPSEIRVFDIHSPSNVSILRSPANRTIEFVHVSSSGEIFAVLRSTPTRFSWAKWNDREMRWDDLWAGNNLSTSTSNVTYKWCFDFDRSILYHMTYSYELERWISRTGMQLPTLHLPETNVLSVAADGAGSTIALGELLTPLPLISQPPWSVSWFRGNSIAHELMTSSRYDKSPPYFLPLAKNGKCWLTSVGLKTDLTSQSPTEILSIEGKKAPGSRLNFQGSQLLLTEDSRVLVELKHDVMESWHLANDSSEEFPLRYASQGRKPTPWRPRVKGGSGGISLAGSSNPSQVVSFPRLASISRQGKLLVVLANDSIHYSVTPFSDWKSIDSAIMRAADVTALACSASETAILFGQRTGDIAELQLADHSLVRYTKGHNGQVETLLSIPDGKTLASGGEDGKIVIWDVGQKEVRLSLSAHRSTINTLYWEPATETLLSGGKDGFIRKWPAVSKSSETEKVDSQFRAPNPSEQWTEIKSQPDPKVQLQREIAAEFNRRKIWYRSINFGMRVASNVDVSTFDQLGIDSIAITTQSDLRGFDFDTLTKLPDLRFLQIQHPEVTIQEICKLAEFTSLYSMRIINVDLRDMPFDEFKESKNLRILDLRNCKISDEQVKYIAERFPDLFELNLASSRLTDAAAESIGKFLSLRTLNLSGTSITDASTRWFKGLRRMEDLDISGVSITAAGLTQLQDLKLLESLTVRGLNVAPDDFRRLWPRLKTIDIRRTLATPQSVRKLLNDGISTLHVSPSVYADTPEARVLVQLGPLPSKLEIDGTLETIGDAMAKLENGSSITSFVWPSENSQPSSAALLNSLPNLRSLTISKYTNPDSHLPPLQNLVQINHLDISALPSTTDEQFAVLCKIPNVDSVKTKTLTKEILKRLAAMPNLRSLEYSAGEDLSVVGVSLPNLKHIDCKDRIDSAKLSKVASKMSQLESLKIRIATKTVTSDAMLKALAKLPSLKSLHVQRQLSQEEIEAVKLRLPRVSLTH